MHEIITLQLGEQANYLATHFWNTQESYFTYSDQDTSPIDHDIHFRPGLAPDGTETYMPRTVIYDMKGNFGTLRKVNALYDVEDGSSSAPQALWEHDLLDRDLRPFVEEADCMQGVQVLQDKRLIRLANKARALTELYKQASIVVPLAVPDRLSARVQLDATSQWHTSALLAAAVESAMLPARLRDASKRETLSSMADVLNVMGKQSVAGLQMGFAKAEAGQGPEKDARQRKLTEEELSEGVQLDLRFTPSDQLEAYSRLNGFNRPPRVFSQLVASRGYGDEEPEDVEVDERGRRVRRSGYEPVTKSYTSALKFPLLDSYPEIFKDDDGEALADSINVTTSLSTDSSVSKRLSNLRSTVIRSIGVEDREQIGNDLMEMADEYHEGWSSGSDTGEDD
ncbi:mtDNA inheritance, partitioning of the mitochondrial organelle [Collariella sp. IMI 366227]|nr:mtDNA inheritance, partitioning of the mitochondrial organelle [Collariella sp. IMI 366227]